LSKKLAILALAVFWLLGTDPYPLVATGSSTTKPAVSSDQSPTPPHPKSKRRARNKATATVAPTRLRRARGRRQTRGYSPWRISSFGDPAAEDNPAGDDPVVRQAALDALGNWNGSIVVVDPNTGRILSIVNQRLALSSGFTPCSTFKPVVALAALKQGIITPRTKLYVGGRLRIDVTEALAKSNNVFFLKLGEMLGFTPLAHYARQFGLGQKSGGNIVGESPGRFPASAPKEGGVGYLAYYGQDMEVTPLQMAALISAIANGGTLFELQYPRSPEERTDFEPKVRRRLDDLVSYIPQIKDGLAAAVLYGTARQAYDPQMQIYGKTGTCSEDGARLGWFVSYAQEQQPKVVAVVLLRGGRMMFGPHAAEIAGRFYHDLIQRQHPATQARSVGPSAGPSQR
jgi:penicillin-binding protein 2